jgi:hypothetical protein
MAEESHSLAASLLEQQQRGVGGRVLAGAAAVAVVGGIAVVNASACAVSSSCCSRSRKPDTPLADDVTDDAWQHVRESEINCCRGGDGDGDGGVRFQQQQQGGLLLLLPGCLLLLLRPDCSSSRRSVTAAAVASRRRRRRPAAAAVAHPADRGPKWSVSSHEKTFPPRRA